MKDIIALSGLAASWTDLESTGIAESLAGVLMGNIDLDLIFVRVAHPLEDRLVEVARSKHCKERDVATPQVKKAVAHLLHATTVRSVATVIDPFSGGSLRVTVVPIGAAEQKSLVLAASQRADFPNDQDRLILGIGANQAAIGLQRQLTELALKASQEHLRAVLDSAGDGIYVMGGDTCCTYLNPIGAAMLGYETGELIGRPLHDLIHHTHVDGRHHPVQECPIFIASTTGVQSRIDDDVFWCKDGTPVPVTYSVAPMMVDGRASGAVVTYRDISERKQAQAEAARLLRAIEAERRLLADVFEASPSFMCVLSGPDHVIERANKQYLKLVGHRDILGKPVCKALPEVVEQGFITLLDNVYATGTDFVGKDVPISFQGEGYSTAQQYYLDFVYQTLHNPDDEVIGIFVQGVDLTEHKLAEDENARLYEQLCEQDRRKDEFIATLAHELRNPLAPIRTGLALLKAAPLSTVPGKTHEIMERQVSHMVHLIDDLLDVSRITSGKVQLKKEHIDVSTVFENALELSKPAIEERGHAIIVSTVNRSLILDADPTRMAQIVSNLLNNAAKYTPPGGRIEMSAERDGIDVIIRISDTGVGIADDALPKVFELFTQVGRTLDRSEGGLGIGLALVKKLVEMHGGSVTATSPGLGHGSTFSVRLPLLPDSEKKQDPARQGAEAVPTPVPLSILIVDDNIDAAEMLSMFLELDGHIVRSVHTGPEALTGTLAQRPDLILLDIGLPGMSGYEVARQLRSNPLLSDTILVAVTGWGAEDDLRRAQEAGFNCHLTKPVQLNRLKEFIRGVVKAPAVRY